MALAFAIERVLPAAEPLPPVMTRNWTDCPEVSPPIVALFVPAATTPSVSQVTPPSVVICTVAVVEEVVVQVRLTEVGEVTTTDTFVGGERVESVATAVVLAETDAMVAV
jgi:hypothetical protein